MMQSGAPMAAPTMEQQQQQQHQQWMQQQPQYHHPQYQQQPPPAWNQQPPPQQQQQVYSQPPQPQQQQQYSAAAQPQAPTSADDIRTLWIGDLQHWMDENFIKNILPQNGEVISVKVIRNKQSGQSDGYGFIEFVNRAAAERNLQTYNGTLIPSSEVNFRLNWASFGGGERRQDDGPDFTIFVGDLAADVTDYMLQETFKSHYTSVKGAKVVTDRATGRSKGYGFVKFADENEQIRAMTEMNGMFCSSRAMRIGAATTKNNVGAAAQQYPKASYPITQGTDSENDPNNTTIFVGGLDASVTEDYLRQAFSQFGELIHVKIPVGKRCGFVQFAQRACAEEALLMLNGRQLGAQNIRLSWGRSPNKQQQDPSVAAQPQPDQAQWNGSGAPYQAYGYNQGYETYGYAPQQDQNMYAYAPYPGYGNYPQQYQQQ